MKDKKMRVFSCLWTRPRVFKMAPIILEMKAESSQGKWLSDSKGQARFKVVVCATAQHREMLDQGA